MLVYLEAALALLGFAPRPCRCGHPRAAHDHYRTGSDCGLCAMVARNQRLAGFPLHAVNPGCTRYRPTWRRA